MLGRLIGLIPAPWRAWIALAAGIALAVACFTAGKTWESNARDALELKRSEAARVEEGRLSAIAYDLGMALARGHVAAEADRLAWEKDRRRLRNADLVKVDYGSGAPTPVGGTPAVRFSADFVRLFDAGLCIGAAGDCDAGADAALPAAGASR